MKRVHKFEVPFTEFKQGSMRFGLKLPQEADVLRVDSTNASTVTLWALFNDDQPKVSWSFQIVITGYPAEHCYKTRYLGSVTVPLGSTGHVFLSVED